MPRSRNIRRRPSTPNLKLTNHLPHLHTAADPTSPPETPTTSPPLTRKSSLKPRHQPDFFDFLRPLEKDPNIRPVGNGHQFSYQPMSTAEQLSPRSSSSDDDTDEDEDGDDSSNDDSSESASVASLRNTPGLGVSEEDDDESKAEMSEFESDSDSEISNDSDASEGVSVESDDEEVSTHLTATTSTVACNFILEDIDPMDSDCEGLDVLLPTEIESNRSRSRSRHRGLDKDMMNNLKNLNCSNETSDDEGSPNDMDPDEMFLRRREELRKFRRMSMGSSFGKRTHSELSDSEDDGEGLDVNDVGSSARRLRRKLHRTSLLFQDPPPERIEELEEPDSGEDEAAMENPLLRELPYFAMEVMEMDSS